jgi:hypothetical protein
VDGAEVAKFFQRTLDSLDEVLLICKGAGL